MAWERARKPEQKAARRDSILRAARTLFSDLEYDEISLNSIAREAGISKPNIYRYFSTREEIFLAIFDEEQASFGEMMLVKLKGIRAKDRVDAICRAWIAVALEHPTFLDLLPQLSKSMEKNSSYEQLVDFKKKGKDRLSALIGTFVVVYPELNSEQWLSIVQCGFSMICGLWPFSNPGDNVVEAMQHPEVNQEPWEFEPVLYHGLSALIRGTIEMNKES